MAAQCNKDIEAAEQELSELRSRRDSSDEFKRHMDEIRAAMRAAERNIADGVVTKEFIDTFVDKILITPIEKNKMRLDVRIFTGENSEKYLNRLKTRANSLVPTGQMPKKMIEAYENGIK